MLCYFVLEKQSFIHISNRKCLLRERLWERRFHQMYQLKFRNHFTISVAFDRFSSLIETPAMWKICWFYNLDSKSSAVQSNCMPISMPDRLYVNPLIYRQYNNYNNNIKNNSNILSARIKNKLGYLYDIFEKYLNERIVSMIVERYIRF